MDNRTPRPQAIARKMVTLCEKLWKSGDQALRVAKNEESPLRAKRYDSTRHGGGSNDDPGYNDQTGEVGSGRAGRGTLFSRFVDALWGLDRSIDEVEDAYGRIINKAEAINEKGRRAQPGEGYCIACGDWMPGTKKDRIKSGFCPTHNTGWNEAKRRGTARSTYIHRIRQRVGYDGKHHE